MDTATAELRYLDILDSLSVDELNRLHPKVRSCRYRFPRLLAETGDSFSVGVDMDVLLGSVRELKEKSHQRVEAQAEFEATELRLEGAQSKLRRGSLLRQLNRREGLLKDLEAEADALYGSILDEFIFISRSIDLDELIRLHRAYGAQSTIAKSFLDSMEELGQDRADQLAAERIEVYADSVRELNITVRAELTSLMSGLEASYAPLEDRLPQESSRTIEEG